MCVLSFLLGSFKEHVKNVSQHVNCGSHSALTILFGTVYKSSPTTESINLHAVYARMISAPTSINFFPLYNNARTTTPAAMDLPDPPAGDFASYEDVLAAAREYGYSNGFDLAVHERYPRGGGEPTRVTLRCSKGRNKAAKETDTHESKRRNTSSQMTACPYRIALKRRASGVWMIEKILGRDRNEAKHNHEFLPATAFSSFRQKSLVDYREKIITMWKAGIKPRQIITSLQEEGGDPDFSYQDLQNLLHSMRREELAGRTPIQWLFDVCSPFTFIACTQGPPILHTNP
jgi:hypothetical protein